MSLGKDSPYIFTKFNPLNTDTPLVRTFSMAPSESVLTGFECLPNGRFMGQARQTQHFAPSVKHAPPLASRFALVWCLAQNGAFASLGPQSACYAGHNISTEVLINGSALLFTRSSEPREGLVICRAKDVPSFVSYFKTPSIHPGPGDQIHDVTLCSQGLYPLR